MPRKKSLEEQARLAACKVKKKGVESKRRKMEKVRDLVDNYQYCYVFDICNFRNQLMKQLKTEWSTSCFFCGKVSPTTMALGRTPEGEYRENLHLLSRSLQHDANGAHRGLLFTNSPPKTVCDFFNNYKVRTFAKTGFVATNDFVVKQGVLEKFVFSQEYTLRKLGLAVMLRNGKLWLDADHTICQRGQPLRPEQCKLLELFNEQQAEFKMVVYSYWHDHKFEQLVEPKKKIVQETNENGQETKMMDANDVDIANNNNIKNKNNNNKNNKNGLNGNNVNNDMNQNDEKLDTQLQGKKNKNDKMDKSELSSGAFGSGVSFDLNDDASNIAAFMNEDDDSDQEDEDVDTLWS